MELSWSFVDWPPSRTRPGEGGGSEEVPAKCPLTSCHTLILSSIYIENFPKLFDILKVKLPRVGRAEMLKLQEAIPPFSLIEDSIQGRRAETLVKTAKSCWLQLSPSLLLTIPTRMWEPPSFTIVSGPPLSPWEKRKSISYDILWHGIFWFMIKPCKVLFQQHPHTQSYPHP